MISPFGVGGPGGPCQEDDDVCEGEVAMHRTGSDELVNSVVCTSGPGGLGGPCDEEGDVSETVVSVVGTIGQVGPGYETGLVADAGGDNYVI